MKKGKTLTIAVAVVLIATIASISAYYTGTDNKINAFTIGDVDIALNEPLWGDVEDIRPGEELDKDPQIENTGTNSAFVFLEVEIPKKEIYTYDPDTGARLGPNLTQLFEPDSINNAWALIETDTSGDSVNRYVYVYGTNSECLSLPSSDTTPALFSKVKYCYGVEGQSLDKALHSINIKAYGIQDSNITGEATKNPPDVWSIIKNQDEADDGTEEAGD